MTPLTVLSHETSVSDGSPSELLPKIHSGESLKLNIQGMTCSGCAARIERRLLEVRGVTAAAVNFAAGTASISLSDDPPALNELVRAVESVGYKVGESHPLSHGLSGPRRAVGLVRVIVTFLAAAPVVVLAMAHGHIAFVPMRVSHFLQCVLTSLVVLYGGAPIFGAAWRAILHRTAEMNVLVAIGAGAAYLYSLVVYIWVSLPDQSHQLPLYFEAAAAVIAFVTLGRFLEGEARDRAGAAVRSLLSSQPSWAMVQRNGIEDQIRVEDLRVGDLIRIRAGEIIPVDGEILEGSSALDEALVTGESLAVERGAGDTVISGSINTYGTFVFRAARVGSETTIRRIAALVTNAQSAKLPIARLADRVSARFTPLVLVIAGVAFALWFLFDDPQQAFQRGLLAAISVLVISCPCALGLATPVAILVASGRAAQRGLLVRSGTVLEQIEAIKVVVFDKTGTLTVANSSVIAINTLVGSEHDLLCYAASVEAGSDHPLAAALVKAAQKRGIALRNADRFRSVPGKGVIGNVDGHEVVVGSAPFLSEHGITIPDTVAQQPAPSVWVAIDGRPCGSIEIKDVVRAEAEAAVRALTARGIVVAMVTGDRSGMASSVAREVGIEMVWSEVPPGGKQEIIKNLRLEYGSVMFVGDGINDAPALAEADVGVAMGTGSGVALETSQVTLLRSHLELVPELIQLSRATMRNVRQNLFWAFFYNILGIPLAAGVFFPFTGWLLSPVFASLAMSASSLAVVTNSLRLRHAI